MARRKRFSMRPQQQRVVIVAPRPMGASPSTQRRLGMRPSMARGRNMLGGVVKRLAGQAAGVALSVGYDVVTQDTRNTVDDNPLFSAALKTAAAEAVRYFAPSMADVASGLEADGMGASFRRLIFRKGSEAKDK